MVCIGYAYEATRIFDPPAIADPIGPRAFPLFLGATGTVLIALILLERAPRASLEVTRTMLRDLLGIVAALAAYALVLPRLGFILATTAVLTAGFAYAGGRRPLVPAALFAVAIYLLFTRLLDLRLPTGLLGWL